MNRQRTIAKITGYSLVLMALIAAFSLGYAYTKFNDSSQLEFAQKTLTENIELYKLMLVGIILIIILDILISWTLFQYFKNDNKKLAILSSVFRIFYTLIFCIATYYLTINIEQPNNKIVLENYKTFENIWSFGLVVFGVHLLFIGLLMKLHQSVPKILGYTTILAGISYIIVHILKTTCPDLSEFTKTLNNILALPMALGEIGLAIWLIIKGGKIEKMKTSTANKVFGVIGETN